MDTPMFVCPVCTVLEALNPSYGSEYCKKCVTERPLIGHKLCSNGGLCLKCGQPPKNGKEYYSEFNSMVDLVNQNFLRLQKRTADQIREQYTTKSK